MDAAGASPEMGTLDEHGADVGQPDAGIATVGLKSMSYTASTNLRIERGPLGVGDECAGGEHGGEQ
jgi:hypothetical protein